ncbi:MAG: hypothetical protein HYU97_08625 [Deltaproteobacteria bacterium]|nr:hypothetical protein [Deltaproteobacteria bacterium]
MKVLTAVYERLFPAFLVISLMAFTFLIFFAIFAKVKAEPRTIKAKPKAKWTYQQHYSDRFGETPTVYYSEIRPIRFLIDPITKKGINTSGGLFFQYDLSRVKFYVSF